MGVLDFGEENEGYSMVLEYVHGYDLGRWLKFAQLAPRPVACEHALYVTLRVLAGARSCASLRRRRGLGGEQRRGARRRLHVG